MPLDTFLAQVEAEIGARLSKLVKEDFDVFLECGILAHGFLRLRCTECAHETLVASFLSPHAPARFVLPLRSWKLNRPCRARSSSASRSQASTTLLTAVLEVSSKPMPKEGDPPKCQLQAPNLG